MTNATILSLLCLMMIISNEPPNSTSNNARASSVVTTSTSMNKFDSRDASECDEQPRIRVSNYDHPQMIQLKDLDQTVQEASPSETLTTVSHIFGEVIYSLWYIIPDSYWDSGVCNKLQICERACSPCHHSCPDGALCPRPGDQ